MKKILILIISTILIYNIPCYAEENTNSINTQEIIKSQKESMGISDFLEEAKNYSSDLLGDTEIETIFSNAISGNVENKSLIKKILENLFKEFKNSISSIAIIIVVVIIHSILKTITDSLENSAVSQIAYYVSYILIITIIMKNFADIITLIKSSIENIVTFVNCLLPILIALLITSGGATSAITLEPVILFLLTMISNMITKVLIPFVLASITLSIVSNISSKAQVNKLSKFINSSAIWILGTMLTLFVSVTSLEASLSKRC